MDRPTAIEIGCHEDGAGFIGGQDLLLWPWAANEALNNTVFLHFKPALVNLQMLLHMQL